MAEGDLARIKAVFDEVLEPWLVELPPDDLAERRAGSLRQRNGSGSVRYAFGSTARGEYLEFYAFHRIWGDAHQRVYASGEVEHLDVLGTSYIESDDAEESRRRREQMHERNRRLMEDLDRAGLREGGPVPMSFEINAHLVTGDRDLETPDP